MDASLPEIIDRITILRLKIENSRDSLFKKEFEKELVLCNLAVKEFEKKGAEVTADWIDELYTINRYQWELESSMKDLKERGGNLEMIGKIYIKLQISNKKRVAIKNKISEVTGSGFKDIKMN